MGGLPDLGVQREIQPSDLPLEGIWQNFAVFFKKDKLFPMGYPQGIHRLFAPIDDVHGAISAICNSARMSLVAGMYAWDDEEIDALFREKLRDEKVFVQLSLDKSQAQAAGTVEPSLLKKWHNDQIGNSVAIGRSVHGAISHMKVIVVDGILTIQGSTNLSASGETKQNNECSFILDPVFAAESRARLDVIHDEMLKQMVKK